VVTLVSSAAAQGWHTEADSQMSAVGLGCSSVGEHESGVQVVLASSPARQKHR
jgi:hypothetical protein